VNQSPHSISKQHVHFLRFDDRCDFPLTKRCMDQGLSLAIRSSTIVRRASFRRNTANFLGLIWNSRTANWTTNACNSSGFCNRGDYVTARFVARKTDLLNSIPDFKDSLLFHIFSSSRLRSRYVRLAVGFKHTSELVFIIESRRRAIRANLPAGFAIAAAKILTAAATAITAITA
jgi:hypothetical protein